MNHFIQLVATWDHFLLIGQELVFLFGVGVVVGLFVWCFGWFALFDVSGLSYRSTTLAQLHDCHCCNDERSIVQKKTLLFLVWVVFVLGWVCFDSGRHLACFSSVLLQSESRSTTRRFDD